MARARSRARLMARVLRSRNCVALSCISSWICSCDCPLQVEPQEYLPVRRPETTEGKQRARVELSLNQTTLRMPWNQRHHARRCVATLPDVFGNALCPHAQPDRGTHPVERTGIAYLVREFKRPNEGFFYGVLLVPWPQIAEQLEPPAVEPFVQIQHSGTIEGQRLDRGVWNRPGDGKCLESRSRDGRSRHAAVGDQLPKKFPRMKLG
jgi:hypothetical protein